MSTLLDTNILTHSVQPQHPMHRLAVDAVAMLRQQGEELCLVPQNFYEFWVVCTRPAAQNGLGLAAAESEAELARLKSLFRVLDETPGVFAEWERLVVQYQVLGKNGHDARLVAAMNAHGVQRLLTFNRQDFQRYQGITALTPQDLLGQATPP